MSSFAVEIENFPVAALVCDPSGEIAAINQKACRLLNIQRSSATQKIDQIFDFRLSDITGCQCIDDVLKVIKSRSEGHNTISVPYNNPPITHLRLHIQHYLADQTEMISIVISDVSENKKLIDAFEYKESLLDHIVATSNDALIVFDGRGCIELFSPAAEALFGRSSTEMIIEDIFCLFDDGAHEKIQNIIDNLKLLESDQKTMMFEDIHPLNVGGFPFPSSIVFSRLNAKSDDAVAASDSSLFSMVVSDKSVIHQFVNSINDAYLKADDRGYIADMNNKAESLFGYDRKTLINKHISFLRLVRSSDLKTIDDIHSLANVAHDEEFFCIRKDEDDRLVLNFTVWPQEINHVRLNNLIIKDLSQKKIAEQNLIASTYTDPLTSISNRSNFVRTVKHVIERGEKFALIVIDLDRFKEVNDVCGHDYGDELLVTTSHRLMACVREQDLVSRMGGDEFTIIIHGMDSEALIDKVVARIFKSFQSPFCIKRKQLMVSVSMGIALFPQDGQTADDIYKAADMAMYAVKRSGKDGYKYFAMSMYQHYERHKVIERSLFTAAENNEFTLCFQPKISFSQNRLVGFEALIRWNHAELGNLPPSEFIPIAEGVGTIVPITQWVMDQSIKFMNQWSASSPKFRQYNPTLAVNISPNYFQYDLFDDIQSCLCKNNYNPRMFEIEITESTLLSHSDDVINCLNQLSALGVQISMDDFGTGYSSLQYLKHFKLNTIKIDRSFIKDMEKDSHNNFIIESIISIAKRLNLHLVAEGVENEYQLNHLVALGCDVFQGYYYARPIPSEHVLDFVDGLEAFLASLSSSRSKIINYR